MAFQRLRKEDGGMTFVTLGGYNETARKENPTSVEGYYAGVITKLSGFLDDNGLPKTQVTAVIKTDTGNVGVNAPTVLRRILEAEEQEYLAAYGVKPIGVRCRIEFIGYSNNKKPGRKPAKLFDLQFDRDDIDLSILGEEREAAEAPAPVVDAETSKKAAFKDMLAKTKRG